MDGDISVMTVGAGDPQFDFVVALVEAMRSATTPLIEASGIDPRDGMSLLSSAGTLFAGIQVGMLIGMGALRTQDRRRAGDVALASFRFGLKLGENRVARETRSVQ